MPSPYREVYSKCLLEEGIGYPLWNPQLNLELRESYQLEGLKIGDVGLLSPKNGSFDVLFNITLPPGEQPYPELVGEEFEPVILWRDIDLDTQRNAVTPTQCVFPRGSIQLISSSRSRQEHDREQEPPRAEYEFDLSVEDGAVLILPEGAESCDLKNERKFLNEAIRHGVEWYACATQQAGRLIRNDDSLYLITGFHKARSWSLGVTHRGSSSIQGTRSLRFEVGEISPGSITARAYIWEPVQSFLGHVGPLSPYDIPNYVIGEWRRGVNQTIFVRSFRITINNLLILKTVSVKTQEGATFGGLKDYVKNILWSGPSEPMPSSSTEDYTDNTAEQDSPRNHAQLHADTHMVIDHVPDVPQTFHPGDMINRYMLKKVPHAKFALTHDSLWIKMLRKGLLELEDFSCVDRLENVLSEHYQTIYEDSAVYIDIFPPREPQSPPDVPGLFSGSSYSVETCEWSLILNDDAGLCQLTCMEFCQTERMQHAFLVLHFSHPDDNVTAHAVIIVDRTTKDHPETSMLASLNLSSQSATKALDRVHVMAQEDSLERYLSNTYGAYRALSGFRYPRSADSSPSALQLSILLPIVTDQLPLTANSYQYAATTFDACKLLFPGYGEEPVGQVNHSHAKNIVQVASLYSGIICNYYDDEWLKVTQRRRASQDATLQQEIEQRLDAERKARKGEQQDSEDWEQAPE